AVGSHHAVAAAVAAANGGHRLGILGRIEGIDLGVDAPQVLAGILREDLLNPGHGESRGGVSVRGSLSDTNRGATIPPPRARWVHPRPRRGILQAPSPLLGEPDMRTPCPAVLLAALTFSVAWADRAPESRDRA